MMKCFKKNIGFEEIIPTILHGNEHQSNEELVYQTLAIIAAVAENENALFLEKGANSF